MRKILALLNYSMYFCKKELLDMTEKEIDEEHERAVDEIIDNDIFNVYKKVYRNKTTKSEISKIPA